MPLLDARDGPSYGAIPREENHTSMDYERDQLLQDGYETDGDPSDISTLDEAQEGVRKIEAINMTWTTRSLMIAYVRFVSGLQPNPVTVLTWHEVYFSWPSARPWRARRSCHCRHMPPVLLASIR